MKKVRVAVLDKDVDTVLKYLGRQGIMQFSTASAASIEGNEAAASIEAAASSEAGASGEAGASIEAGAARARLTHIEGALSNLKENAAFLEVALPEEPSGETELPGEQEERALLAINDAAGALERELYNTQLEKAALEEQLAACMGTPVLPAATAPLEGLPRNSFLNVRLGRLSGAEQGKLHDALGERAVILPLGDHDEVLVASSRTGRFAMDSGLSQAGFVPFPEAAVPEAAPPQAGGAEAPPQAAPPQAGSERQAAVSAALAETGGRLAGLLAEREHLARLYEQPVKAVYASFLMAESVARLKQRLSQTKNTFELCGWVEARRIPALVHDLDEKTGGRVSVVSYESWEVPEVRSGAEKVPVALRHGRLAGSFQPLVLSYGAPAYGTIDPTPFTTVLFAVLFAVMFGDVGQGAVLLAAGILASCPKIRLFAKYRHFGGPLKIAGACSMATGFLYGGVFSNETLLEAPTHAISAFLASTAAGRALGIHETERLLNLMPEAGNLEKLFYFFGFTLGIGVLVNSLGIVLNIINSVTQRRWERAFFSKHGVAGLAFFWYALFIAVRALVQKGQFRFAAYDALALAVPIAAIVCGPFIWRLATRKNPFEEGFFAFIMEGIVEILETVSGYVSNTVSFLRVGAFALSHAVLSFIIFTMAEKVAGVTLGGAWSLLIIIFGNALIIVLEGMIVAIQVIRLQYYEFFGKFFTETGTEFSPFKFSRRPHHPAAYTHDDKSRANIPPEGGK
ncbi:MAG: V-type ATP synthase subunit I [Spirochaetaceae bacterium]|nr:V-type ATP synthase subunit I [Spirochaetaceae bacterium]